MANRHPWYWLPVALVVLSGCVPDTGETDPRDAHRGGVETGDVAADTVPDGTEDVGRDAVGDAGGDADALSGVCSFPSPAIAGTPQTNELAEDPAHCGQEDYTWVDDASLGGVTDLGARRSFRKEDVEAVLESQDITPPRPPQYDVQLRQFSYRTQDRGDLTEATALVGYPEDYDGQKPIETVLLLHGTAGFADHCAPSETIVGQGLAALFATMGYMVVAPDFIGMKGLGEPTGFLHPYLVGQATAIASLDAVRALPHLPADERGDLCPSNRVLTFGPSQGGHAALWVDRLQPYYARELEMLGTVATVPPAGLVEEGERAIRENVSATKNLAAFLGSAPEWYGHDDRLDEVFESPYDEEVPEALRDKCDPSKGVDFPDSNDELFTDSLIQQAADGELADASPWGCMAAENDLIETSVDRIPREDDSYGILYVLSEEDDLVHTPIERESFETLCNRDVPMQYLECEGAGHADSTIWSLSRIFDFMDERRAGEPFQAREQCEVPDPVTCPDTP